MNALVSVILPVRNGQDYIREAVDSILRQTYPHFELVIVDASDDDTPQIIDGYGDSRIKYRRQRSAGSVNGYNEALDHYVSGNYVTFIHHDDIIAPEKLYEQLRAFERYKNVDCAYNDLEFVDESLRTLRVRGHEDFYNRLNDLRAVIMIGYGVSNLGMNIMVSREFIQKRHLRYNADIPTCCDHEMVFQLMDAGCNFKHVPKTLLKYRVHGNNESNDREIVNQQNLKIYAKYVDRFPEIVSATNYSENERVTLLARLYYRVERYSEATRLLAEHVRGSCDPWAAFYLGTGYYRYAGAFAEAERYLDIARAHIPYRAECANNLGCCMMKTGRTGEAKHLFAEALRMEPNYYDARYNFTRSEKEHEFNPRITDREIDPMEQIGVVWKAAEMERERSDSLQPAGNL